jgi:hypothetical protein
VRHGWKNRVVAATLLIAAVAAYLDLPRLYQTSCIGDTLNAVRVFDAIQHARMAQLAADTGAVDAGLNEGLDSLKLVLQVTPLQAMTQPMFEISRPVILDEDAPAVGENEYQPLTAMAGALFTLDLPPPGLEALWQPPRLQVPSLPGFTHTARGPPRPQF